MHSSLLGVIGALFLSGGKPTLNGPCDAEVLDGLRSASRKMHGEQLASVTVAEVTEACSSKLPADIAEDFKAVLYARPEVRAGIIWNGLNGSPRFASGSCPDWKAVAKRVAQLEAAQRAKALYEGCHFERLDLMTVAELDASWKGSGLALISGPMYVWLVDNGMEKAEAKRLARQMLLRDEESKGSSSKGSLMEGMFPSEASAADGLTPDAGAKRSR